LAGTFNQCCTPCGQAAYVFTSKTDAIVLEEFSGMQESAPQESAPQESAPQESAPQESAPQESAPQKSSTQESPAEESPTHDSALDAFFAGLAQESATVILPFFRMHQSVSNKVTGEGFDPVTEADRAAEVVIRQRIKAEYPSHAIRGEEFGRENEGAEYEWIIDPIDGTRAFICGLPTWGTLVGLTRHGRPVYGMMNQPHVGERFVGNGTSAKLITAHSQSVIAVRPCTRLADAFIATTSPRIIKGAEGEAYDRLEASCRLARYGTDCYAYALLAAGQIDLVCETGLQAYDIVPLIPIIEGAGGIVTSWDGGSVMEGGSVLAAGDARLHAQALEMLSHR
jgi:histidinol phosphatase-like enzyme (inositol monophosphatase family)